MPVNGDTHRLWLRLEYALRGKHHLHLRGTYPEGHRAKSAMSGSMAVAAHYRVARECQAIFGPDDVDYTVALMPYPEDIQTELSRIAVECLHLIARHRIGNRLILVFCRNIVVGRTDSASGAEHPEAAAAQTVKGLRTCHLMAIMPVDIQLCRSTLNDIYSVGIPDFIKKSFRHRYKVSGQCTNLLIASINASADAAIISVLAENP